MKKNIKENSFYLKKYFYLCKVKSQASVVELVDTIDSKSIERKLVRVQVPSDVQRLQATLYKIILSK
jgi:hypothetical protein